MPHAVEAQSLTIGTPVRPPDSFSLIDADLFRLSIVWVLVDCIFQKTGPFHLGYHIYCLGDACIFHYTI